MKNEILGRFVVFSYTPLQDTVFQGKNIIIPIVFSLDSKVHENMGLKLDLRCDDGVDIGNNVGFSVMTSVVGGGNKTFSVKFVVTKAGFPHVNLCSFRVTYLGEDGKTGVSDEFSVSVAVVRNPALTSNKDEKPFENVLAWNEVLPDYEIK